MDDQTKLKDEVMGRIVGSKRIRRRALCIIAAGLASIVVLYILSLTLGAYRIPFEEALEQMVEIIVTGGNPEDMSGRIIYNLRMPRELAVIMVGAGLAVAGAVMQALIHNPLVDPYITGVSSGASLGVMIMTISGLVTTSITTMWMIPAAGIVGAVIAFTLTMVVAEAAGGKAMSYVLGGTVIGMGLSAGTTLIMSFNANHLANISSWMFGSFANIEWSETMLITIPVAVIIGIILFNARNLNTMLLGEDQAMYLGMDSRRFKRNMLILIAVLTAFCVSFCGVIGFIGLIVPHLCRMVVGGDNRVLLPTSMIVGPVVLMLADVFCRSFTVSELPIGAIISVIGVPFFVYLMVKEGKRYAM
ncbi:MAG: iron ABC transporter permease [Candidatus Methanomethylophilaceae archaeon]|nr:iron ABC transporter permease [Candidatus Methanomethylophilaceae archaeon]MBR7152770.1 iron ABC transporter permease [Candidatus Methanomethylophilaceae archaeon]